MAGLMKKKAIDLRINKSTRYLSKITLEQIHSSAERYVSNWMRIEPFFIFFNVVSYLYRLLKKYVGQDYQNPIQAYHK